MFFVQINAPATLPIYVCTSWLANFSVDCTSRVAFLMLYKEPFWMERNDCRLRTKEFHFEASVTPQIILFHDVYMCYNLLPIKISYCKSRWSLLAGDKRDLAKFRDRQTPDAVWSQNPYVIQDSVSPGHIIVKGPKINCPYTLMPKVL